MKRSGKVIAILAGLLLISLCVAVFSNLRPDPKDLSHWLRLAGAKDWSAEAEQGKPEAQFLVGLTLIRTNLIIMIDRVPYLSAVPVAGRWFENITYQINTSIDAGQLEEAHRWIEKSAAMGCPPAIEAKNLFPERVPTSGGSVKPAGAPTGRPGSN